MSYPFLVGHGTENDFVLLPDLDGARHGMLAAERVRALCDRRAGIGGDGVMRVIRTDAARALGLLAEPTPGEVEADWFMDYRNADGSVSEMCGNGVRVFGRHLAAAGLVDAAAPVPVATRGGVKVLVFEDDGTITVDMGRPQVFGESVVTVGHRGWSARHVDMGNPHAVAFVDDLAEAGSLLEAPGHDVAVYPDGVNVEFVAEIGERHVGMRVHERGSGETRSCGTGACAVMVAAALRDGAARPPAADLTYRVDVPGGTLWATWTADDRSLLRGSALLVAEGVTDL